MVERKSEMESLVVCMKEMIQENNRKLAQLFGIQNQQGNLVAQPHPQQGFSAIHDVNGGAPRIDSIRFERLHPVPETVEAERGREIKESKKDSRDNSCPLKEGEKLQPLEGVKLQQPLGVLPREIKTVEVLSREIKIQSMGTKEGLVKLSGMTLCRPIIVTLTYYPFAEISQSGQVELLSPKSINMLNGDFFLGYGYWAFDPSKE
jgi:hypothetical protein